MEQTIINGLPISPLTLGTVQLGMSYGIANKKGMPDKHTSLSILRAAADGGVRAFDTAHDYGESEKVLGRFFSNRPDPVLITKLRLEAGRHTTTADLERQTYRCVKMSLANLGVGHLPILLLHNPGILKNHGQSVTSIFQNLKQEGLVNKLGVSFGANTDEQFQTVWDTVKDELYEVVQIPVNIFDHRLFHNGGFQKLRDTRKIVFARSIFLQGLLFLKENELPHQLQEASEALHIIQDISKDTGFTIAQLAVSFIRDLGDVHSLVIGVETLSQLHSTMSLIEGPELPGEVRKICMDRLANVPEKIVNTMFWNS